MTLMEAVKNNKEKIIDIRERDEYQAYHIDGVKNIPMLELIVNPALFLKEDEKYYLMCASGRRVDALIAELADENYHFENIGGMVDYDENI